MEIYFIGVPSMRKLDDDVEYVDDYESPDQMVRISGHAVHHKRWDYEYTIKKYSTDEKLFRKVIEKYETEVNNTNLSQRKKDDLIANHQYFMDLEVKSRTPFFYKKDVGTLSYIVIDDDGNYHLYDVVKYDQYGWHLFDSDESEEKKNEIFDLMDEFFQSINK